MPKYAVAVNCGCAHSKIIKLASLSHGLGSIEVGKRADLLLLKVDPLANISAYDSIETVFLDGQPIARETLRAHD